ncbi:ADP-ribosylglycohydrolase [Saccharopolyspora lacisalsi]|uniref:ADP-ribosylglycohydrolase n=1 Tax=Halosaccharopolyspora lacisalsi TaxID=1000566 RepID=A0A839DYJ7_9PSEU|nr:type VII secretion system-associated protein [Halosaccharopolyspora lacisalsi]MBA8827042.1 ADP-ribosylglycohydrolase [Halosaccharopolyspora lacisalsi]
MLGYRLLPLLVGRNVHIATSSDVHDLMLLGGRAIAFSAPEVTEELRYEASHLSETWLSVPDRMFRDQPRRTPEGKTFVGEYWVDGSGGVTGEYRPNPAYRPSPVPLGFPEPENSLERTLQLYETGHVSDEGLASALGESEFALVTTEDGAASLFPVGDGRAVVAASSTKYLPNFAEGVREGTAESVEPLLAEGDLIIDIGTRHQAQLAGAQLLAALEAGGTDGAAEQAPERSEQATPPPRPAPAPQPPPNPHERFMGSMVAGALGDALGYGIEFQPIEMIRRSRGEQGVTGPVTRDGVAEISDDTQMMLFTLEGLIRAHVARRISPVDNDPIPEVQHAYQRWLHTQNRPWRQAGGPYAVHLPQPDGWLSTNRALYAARAPGNTCMTALMNFAQTRVSANFAGPINDSKGCGGVMRAAPVAVWSNDPAEVFHAAAGTAALTHGHPSGYLSAGVLATIVHQLIRSVSLSDSVRMVRELLIRWRGHEEQLRAMDTATRLAERGVLTPEEITAEIGEGRIGEEALAIGLYAVLATDNLRDAMLLSVNHSGDSDSTGIVCGNIAGAVHGMRGIPHDWPSVLELHDVIEALSRDALAEFSPEPPTDAAWTRRYPAW